MENEELAPEVTDGGEGVASDDSASTDLDADFAAIFGDASEADVDDEVERASAEGEDDKAPEGEEEFASEEVAAEGAEGHPAEGEDDGVTPPARFGAREKQLFGNIKSKTLRKGIQRMVRELESGNVKAINDQKRQLSQAYQAERQKLHQTYAQEIERTQSIRQAVEPYIDKLTFGGKMPLSQSIGELAATHAKLSSKDPKVAVPELQRIAGYLSKRFNTKPEALFGLAEGVAASVQSNDVIRGLQSQVQQLSSQLAQLRAQPAIERIRAEVNSARQEKDAAGRPLWPELHDGNFLARVNPLVEQIMRANPGITYGDAHKQAVLVTRGTPQGQYAQRLPAAAHTNGIKPPSGGSSGSVRGRSAAPSGKVDIVKDAPRGGSIDDDYEYIHRSM